MSIVAVVGIKLQPITTNHKYFERFKCIIVLLDWAHGKGGKMVKENDSQFAGEILTIKEVAQYLRLSEAKIYDLARHGNIPALRIGKVWRFQKNLLIEWLRNGAEANNV